MLKRAISFMLTIICTLTFVFVCPIEVKTKAAVFKGSGTADDPYQISSANDLIRFSSLINNHDTNRDYRYAYYIQTSDIDLNGESFAPIGGSGEPTLFAGIYDGNFHSINNLYIASSERFIGLFGRIGELDRDNCKSVIKNLCVQGNVESIGETGLYVGGIAGEIAYSANIANCCFIGTASNGQYVGGISGRSWCGGSTVSCYSNAILSSTMENAHIGGIIGDVTIGENKVIGSSDFMMKNCCFSGDIISKNGQLPGGIIGCIYYSQNNTDVKLELLNNYYLSTSCNNGVGTDNAEGCTKLSSDDLKDCAENLGSPYITNPVPSFNNGYPIFEWQLEDAEKSKPINIPFVGVGTKEEPYQISTIEDLISLSEVTNDKTTMDYFSGCHYIQTADIDLNNKLFTPIAINCAFEGTYNGNYHKITNLKISTSKSSTGLFSKVTNGGCITKLSVEGKVNSSGNNIGGIAGSLLDSASVTDCDYHGSVDGSENVGALIGTVKNGGTVESCYSDANINGQSAVGGLIGCIQTGLDSNVIKRLYFSGIVKCDDTKQGAVLGINNDKNIAMDNIYFLSDVCGGNAVNSESAVGCTKLSITALKACSDMLGSPFTSNGSTIYGGYPIFEWQSTAYKFKGSGTEGNPYRISTKADLENMRDLINSNYYNKIYGDAHFTQTADIDLEDELWIPIASSNSGQTFRGTYDGACHYIRGLNINSTSESSGLFGITDNAKIHDIVVYGSIIGTVKNNGGIIGTARNNTTVERCGFIGSVTSEIEAGGIIGSIQNGCTVIDCYHNGNVSSKGVSGGIIGSISFDDDTKSANVIIQNCYQSNGIVNGENYSGCIVGSCTIKKGTSNTVSILNCFATADADADTKQAGATKDNTLLVTKSMLKGASEDLGASFMNNTIATLNDGYPVFKWQIKSGLEGDVNNDGVFNIADVIMLQKWLLCAGPLTTWENGDLCKDNRIDVFDLCLMKRKLIEK